MHDILTKISRNERRIVLRREREARASGDWGPWEVLHFAKGTAGHGGWAREFDTAHRNKAFAVLDRTVPGDSAQVRHLMITCLSGIRPTWREMMRVKNELAGVWATAVEVLPPEAEVVDAADAFHIWVLPGKLNFGLHTDGP